MLILMLTEEDYAFFDPYLLKMKAVIAVDDWEDFGDYYPEAGREQPDWSERHHTLQQEALNQFGVHWTQRSQVLGYPDQYDPVPIAREAQIIREGKDPFFKDRNYKPDANEVKKWVLILQLASHNAPGMMWSDMGRLQFIIHRDDLEQLDFTRTYAHVIST
jgi:hypothetical protein